MKHQKTDKRLRYIFAIIIVSVLICALMISGVFSRYTTQMAVANEVDYTNQLAISFKLLDQPITQLEDGSYEKNTDDDAEPTNGYSYQLIPGITLPASPYIEIKGKSEIPAYLYLEVDNTGEVELSFDNIWSSIDVTGKKGGSVYVYDNGSVLSGDDEEEVLTFPTFTVDELSEYPITTEGEVKVYAYMLQQVGEKSAVDTYSEAPSV